MFRQKDVRLIAVNDGTDTLHGDDDFLPFRNIMNEWYAKDTSKKIRSTFKAKSEAGKHVASSPPYGYMKDPDDKNRWIVDEEAAEVVRRIFKLTLEGKGPFQICKILEADKVEIPAYRKTERPLSYAIVDLAKMEETTITVGGRHDPCIVPRAVPCVEAAAALAVYDAWLGRKKEL